MTRARATSYHHRFSFVKWYSPPRPRLSARPPCRRLLSTTCALSPLDALTLCIIHRSGLKSKIHKRSVSPFFSVSRASHSASLYSVPRPLARPLSPPFAPLSLSCTSFLSNTFRFSVSFLVFHSLSTSRIPRVDKVRGFTGVYTLTLSFARTTDENAFARRTFQRPVRPSPRHRAYTQRSSTFSCSSSSSRPFVKISPRFLSPSTLSLSLSFVLAWRPDEKNGWAERNGRGWRKWCGEESGNIVRESLFPRSFGKNG